MGKLTYKSSGVNYDVMDPLKKMAQIAGIETIENFDPKVFREVSDSRGDSASVVILNETSYLAFVQEGLGTKNLVADAMAKINPGKKTYYDAIAQDTVAAIINDLITVGAKPWTILAYWAAGSEEWFKNLKRMEDLVNGWKKACKDIGVAWIGGETPTLSGIINPETIDLGGTAFGTIQPSERYTHSEKLQDQDAIILFESSGIHANGLSLARKIADEFPDGDGYTTEISKGVTYGEALLEPTIIYSNLIQELFVSQVDIHYMVNITGHGWRKLMRHTKPFTYRITKNLPEIPEVLKFIQKKTEMENFEAYGTFNMGAGFAIFVPQKDAENVLKVAGKNGIKAYNAGVVEKGEKQVIIEPLNVTFSANSLQVRI